MKRIIFILAISLATAETHLHSAVVLSLLDPASAEPFAAVSVGETFSINYLVSGLLSPALHRFDTQLGPLPAALTLTEFASDLPSDWFAVSQIENRAFGGINFFGSDLTGTVTLVTATFYISPSAPLGNYTIDLVSAGDTMGLYAASGDPIALTSESFALTIVPEPSSGILFGVGGLLLVLFWRFRDKHRFGRIAHVASPRSFNSCSAVAYQNTSIKSVA